MSEVQINQNVAERICQAAQWNGRRFEYGDCVALLDGQVIGVAVDLDGALKVLRAADADPRRGMVVEVAPLTIDVIRSV